MSKDKVNKDSKKAPNPDKNKAQSDYQSGKTSKAKIEPVVNNKKK